MPELRPDLNGVRVKLPNQPHIYLIDEGKKRHIPDPPTYNSLFRSWEGIVEDLDVNDIETGTTITPGSVIATGDATPHVYLIDGRSKRHIVSPAVMDKYHFRWPTQPVPQAVIDGIPTGAAIS
ncbi:hypothetical protein C5Y96_09265 [Blastopirellula marina]|uniref:Uncharacterized protein n=2 Tax=Pirellulales TaxID=2691354 RepID=A0A2S8FUH1_9BACT|nr:hypothetical protein C5Y96_09265 [Blastopirellula marina]RCS53402.1 hypothetical protein DTL36_09275 [Bremerella cremea]